MQPDRAVRPAGWNGCRSSTATRRRNWCARCPATIRDNVEQQRGKGVFEQSIEALRLLNRLGYGRPAAARYTWFTTRSGPFFRPRRRNSKQRYRQELGALGVEFNRLFTITNMPIKRFARQLRQWGKDAEYMSLLVNHFNPGAVSGLMCRDLVSAGYEGTLYDCDFNQMLEDATDPRGPAAHDLGRE